MQLPLASSAPRGAAAAASAAAGTCPRLRHILTGTFNTLFLHLLTFDTLTKDLTVTLSVPARGPHQYFALGGFIPELSSSSGSGSGVGSSSAAGGAAHQASRIVYATTWSDVRELSAWSVSLVPGQEKVSLINAREILAAGSYVAVQPPPFESRTSPAYGVKSSLQGATSSSNSSGGPSRFLYQAGGPTGEVFELDPTTGAIGVKTQQLVLLPGGEEALAGADKSRKSLRYGAHNVDFDINGLAYVADLGRNAILIYSRDVSTGHLTLLSSNPSPASGDGPRHVVPTACGRWVFAVTEHNSFADAYRVILPSDSQSKVSDVPRLEHVQRVSLLATGADPHAYRGDTIRLSPCGGYLFATTRGMTTATKGLVTGWKVDLEDLTAPIVEESGETDGAIVRFETPTSGGKANAWEWAPRYPLDAPHYPTSSSSSTEESTSASGPEGVVQDLAVLTDDELGYILVMQWDGRDLKEVARTQLPGVGGGESAASVGLKEGEREGASHAIWLS
ncbi:hypothetical protein BCV69DRAFT_313567 [Microstroma glucosiphilum]|uniref:3-carboxy-cis,cis-mucoante lactonizing enzyme n=1 Tax=Pseudomicrostroma glucosiphilum TaxID=1684307 RepID=A0A316U3F0_9BASI|nr:hypothetical protein BCV69DRAFT_313567 [Pseudomicrostroma glucosiphilum]PWN19826.1 hypothetical protein BCV69DRAFT_313567 [Pseudomicrostroma glucosiphilum]